MDFHPDTLLTAGLVSKNLEIQQGAANGIIAILDALDKRAAAFIES
jgi:hypothetical protein